MNKILNTKVNVFLFYFCYTVMLASMMFQQVFVIGSFLTKAYQAIIVILLFVCFMNMSNMNKRRILIAFLTIILAFLTRFISGSNVLLTICLFVIACKDINFDNIVKYDLKIKTLFLIMVIILYFLGMTNVNTHYRNGVVRQSMGFSNPNSFSTYIMSIVAEYLYLHRNKMRIMDFLIAILAIFLIDYYADSRTQIICLAILIMLIVINRIKKVSFEKKLVKFFACNSFIFLAVLSIILVNMYNHGYKITDIINETTAGRLSNPSKFIELYGINLFGYKTNQDTQIVLDEDETITVDNVYMYTLLYYGVIPFIVLCIYMRQYIKYAIKCKENVIIIIMLTFFIGGLMERFCIRLYYNIFLLYFSYMVYGYNKGLDNKKGYLEGEK